MNLAGMQRDYAPSSVKKLACEGHPLLTLIHRDEGWAGLHMVVAVRERRPGPTGYCNFLVTRAGDYEFAPPDREAVREAIRTLGSRLSKNLFGAQTMRSFAGDISGSNFAGLPQWLPHHVDAEDNFYSLNRSVDRQNLAGHVMHIGNGDAKNWDAVCDMVELQTEPGNILILGPNRYESWLHEAKRVGRVEPAKGAQYKGLRCATLIRPRQPVLLVGDSDCPEREGYYLDPQAITLVSCGPAPMWLDYDGLAVVERDGKHEVRFGYYAQMIVNAPIQCVRLRFEEATWRSR